jgi:hypothetical protein
VAPFLDLGHLIRAETHSDGLAVNRAGPQGVGSVAVGRIGAAVLMALPELAKASVEGAGRSDHWTCGVRRRSRNGAPRPGR